MISEFLTHVSLVRRLYDQVLQPVCDQYHITRMELDILLFLHNNPEYDTATDIIKKRRLTKSHVSSSIKTLEEQHYLEKYYLEGNEKSIHLKITEAAGTILQSGLAAQISFFATIFAGFSQEETASLERHVQKMTENVQTALKGGTKHGL